MDKSTPSQAELLDQLLALLRAGCEIRLIPQTTGLGYINADVRVIPPPSTPSRFEAISAGRNSAVAG